VRVDGDEEAETKAFQQEGLKSHMESIRSDTEERIKKRSLRHRPHQENEGKLISQRKTPPL
jgi:hypothetical protein